MKAEFRWTRDRADRSRLSSLNAPASSHKTMALSSVGPLRSSATPVGSMIEANSPDERPSNSILTLQDLAHGDRSAQCCHEPERSIAKVRAWLAGAPSDAPGPETFWNLHGIRPHFFLGCRYDEAVEVSGKARGSGAVCFAPVLRSLNCGAKRLCWRTSLARRRP